MSGADEGRTELRPRVAIVGAGPAGLTAAKHLAESLDGEVLVLDRESQAGGIPRHADHVGYGVRDLRRVTTGPRYARLLRDAAIDSGAAIRTNATVTGWDDTGGLLVTSPSGLDVVRADAVLLATGARERARPARRIPGGRPRGVFTTGQLQNHVHLLHQRLDGARAVVVGAEMVSWSAVMTLRHAGATTVAILSRYARPESYAAFNLPGRFALRVPVLTRSRVVEVVGLRVLEGVRVEDLDSGEQRFIACDVVVMTGDWIPDHELARTGGLDIDPGTKGPAVDTALRTSRRGVFAAGNLLHPVDTADVAALDGAHVAETIRAHLEGKDASGRSVRLVADAPLRWIAPTLLREGDVAPARQRLLCWTDEFRQFPTVTVRQGDRVVARSRLAWPTAPGRVFRIPSKLLVDVDFSGPDVQVGIE